MRTAFLLVLAFVLAGCAASGRPIQRQTIPRDDLVGYLALGDSVALHLKSGVVERSRIVALSDSTIWTPSTQIDVEALEWVEMLDPGAADRANENFGGLFRVAAWTTVAGLALLAIAIANFQMPGY